MRWLLGMAARARSLSLRGRLAVAAGALAAAGVATSAAVSGGRGVGDPYRSPDALASLLAESSGKVVVDREGRPIRGPDGKPLRVGEDGRTLVDSQGRPLRDRRGRRLRLGPGKKLPRAAEPRDRPGKRPARRPPPRPPGKQRPPRAPDAPAKQDQRPVVIGVAHVDDEVHNGLGNTFEVDNQAGDSARQARAVADYLNATGGISGRRLRIESYEVNYGDGRSLQTIGQEICHHFRQLQPLAVVEGWGPQFHTIGCLAGAGVPVVNDWPGHLSRSFFAAHAGRLYAPGGLALDRLGEPYVRRLRAAGFFSGKVRVGLISGDHPYEQPGREAVKAALERARIPMAAEKVVPRGHGADVHSIGNYIANVTSAAVQFRRAGVNRVLSVDNAGSLIGPFMRAAGAQGYSPRYGITTANAPHFLAVEASGEGLASQLHGAAGVGWAPLQDVAAGHEPSPSPNRALCEQIFDRAGVNRGGRNPWGHYNAVGYCDSILAIRAALERSDDVSRTGLANGMHALGGAYASAATLRSWLGAGQPDGVAELRAIAYDRGCRCFRYTGD